MFTSEYESPDNRDVDRHDICSCHGCNKHSLGCSGVCVRSGSSCLTCLGNSLHYGINSGNRMNARSRTASGTSTPSMGPTVPLLHPADKESRLALIIQQQTYARGQADLWNQRCQELKRQAETLRHSIDSEEHYAYLEGIRADTEASDDYGADYGSSVPITPDHLKDDTLEEGDDHDSYGFANPQPLFHAERIMARVQELDRLPLKHRLATLHYNRMDDDALMRGEHPSTSSSSSTTLSRDISPLDETRSAQGYLSAPHGLSRDRDFAHLVHIHDVGTPLYGGSSDNILNDRSTATTTTNTTNTTAANLGMGDDSILGSMASGEDTTAGAATMSLNMLLAPSTQAQSLMSLTTPLMNSTTTASLNSNNNNNNNNNSNSNKNNSKNTKITVKSEPTKIKRPSSVPNSPTGMLTRSAHEAEREIITRERRRGSSPYGKPRRQEPKLTPVGADRRSRSPPVGRRSPGRRDPAEMQSMMFKFTLRSASPK